MIQKSMKKKLLKLRMKRKKANIAQQLLDMDRLEFTDWFNRSVGTYNNRNTFYNRSHYDRF